jgi:hypothetical protein
VIKKCLVCGKEFHIKLSRVKAGRGKYCSNKCRGSFKITKQCKYCGKEFITIPASIKVGKGIYCSRACANKGREPVRGWINVSQPFGEKSYNWRGGQSIGKTRNGRKYMFVYIKKREYILRSHIVMEKYLGRHLLPNEIVHHINENTLDDRLANLQLMTISEHSKYHARIRQLSEKQ